MKAGNALDLLRPQDTKYENTTNGIMNFVTDASLVDSVSFFDF
jgi:hypothetical protein